MFVSPVPRQRSGIAERLGCAMLQDSCVEVDGSGRTGVPGVSAAGDMAHRATVPMPFAAVAPAAAAGAVAARGLDEEPLSEDTGPAHRSRARRPGDRPAGVRFVQDGAPGRCLGSQP